MFSGIVSTLTRGNMIVNRYCDRFGQIFPNTEKFVYIDINGHDPTTCLFDDGVGYLKWNSEIDEGGEYFLNFSGHSKFKECCPDPDYSFGTWSFLLLTTYIKIDTENSRILFSYITLSKQVRF